MHLHPVYSCLFVPASRISRFFFTVTSTRCSASRRNKQRPVTCRRTEALLAWAGQCLFPIPLKVGTC